MVGSVEILAPTLILFTVDRSFREEWTCCMRTQLRIMHARPIKIPRMRMGWLVAGAWLIHSHTHK